MLAKHSDQQKMAKNLKFVKWIGYLVSWCFVHYFSRETAYKLQVTILVKKKGQSAVILFQVHFPGPSYPPPVWPPSQAGSYPTPSANTVRPNESQFKRRSIIAVSNLIVSKLNCRMIVDSNVKFNLVLPESPQGFKHWTHALTRGIMVKYVIIICALSLAQV